MLKDIYLFLLVFGLIIINLFLVIKYVNINSLTNVQNNIEKIGNNADISFWHVVLGVMFLCVIFYFIKFLAFYTHKYIKLI